jgi:hypothetical protein
LQQNPPVPNPKISEALSALRAVAAVPAWPSIRGEDVGRSLAEMAQRDLDAALQLLADRAQFITGATGAAIALRRNGMKDMLCRASTGSNAPELGALLSTEFGLSGESVRTRQLLRCDDAERDARVNREVCRQLGIASVVVMPVVHDDEVLGVFELFSGKTNAFGERDLSAVQRLGQMVETAVRLAQVTESLPETLKSDQSSLAQARSEEQVLDEHILQVEAFGPSLQTKDDMDVLQSATESTSESARPATVAEGAVKKEVAPGLVAEAGAGIETAAVQAVPVGLDISEKASEQTVTAQSIAADTAEKVSRPAKALFWSAVDVASNEKPAHGDLSHMPPVLRGLRKCEACGFPISEARTLCVECEEKKWRGQLKRPQAMPTGAIPGSDGGKSGAQASTAAGLPVRPVSLSPELSVPARAVSVAAAQAGEASEPPVIVRVSASPANESTEQNVARSATEVNPAFVLSAGMENSQSWISANKYVLAVLVLLALLVGGFLILR